MIPDYWADETIRLAKINERIVWLLLGVVAEHRGAAGVQSVLVELEEIHNASNP